MKKLIGSIIAAIMLQGCRVGHAFDGGKWFIPLALFIAFATSAFRYYQFRKGKDNGANYAWVYALIFLGVAIGSIILMINEK